MKRKRDRKKRYVALAVVLIGMLVFLSSCKEKIEKKKVDLLAYYTSPIVTPVSKIEVFNKEEKELLETWEEHKKINDDYIGEIIFESNIINLPFVQGKSNSYYERKNWETLEYDEEGSIFMDSLCSINSSNITIYGHYVYPSLDKEQTHKFSPLALLLKEENYRNNSTVKLVFENEIRYYKIVYVYLLPLNYSNEMGYYIQQDRMFNLPEFTQDFFDNYLSFVKEKALYETGEKINYNDKMLTLQTCVYNRNDLREIIICKEITRKSD